MPVKFSSNSLSQRRTVILIIFCFAALVLSTPVFLHFKNRQPVGDFDFNIPGATVSFLDNGSAGNEKIYTLKGQKTDIEIDFNDIVAYEGQVNPGNTKAAEAWRSMQARPPFNNLLKETWFGPFSSGRIQGYYQLVDVHRSSGQLAKQRNLFFIRAGKPYQISFLFTQSKIGADQEKVRKTWKTLLKAIGISPSDLHSSD